MNKTLELQQNRAALSDEVKAILTSAETANRAVLTPEERTKVSDLTAQIEGITETLAIQARFFGASAAMTGGSAGRRVESIHDNALDKPFSSFGEQLMAIKHAELVRSSGTGAQIDNRLLEIHKRATASAGASEAVPADGGFLIQPDFATDLISIAHDEAVVYNMTRKVPLGTATNSVKIPGVDEQSRADGSRWGGVRMYWQNEADSLTGSKPKFRLMELVLKKLTGLFYATDELLNDAAALGSYVNQAFGEEFGFKLDDGCIRGTGSGQLSGILNSTCLITVNKETGQAASTIVYENIKKMWGRMWPRSRRNAVWLVNTDVEQQLNGMVQVVGTSGVPVYLPPGGASQAPYGMLYGRPVMPIEQCDTVGTAGDILLADFSQYLTIARGALESAVSVHVRFLTDEQTFRFIYRVDGQPSWHTALTPFKGSNTLSPFIALQSR